jgi:hypothetical protein
MQSRVWRLVPVCLGFRGRPGYVCAIDAFAQTAYVTKSRGPD